LEFIQAVLWHATREGFRRVPLPLETRNHRGYVAHGGFLWELAPWLPGTADYAQHPTPARLRAAMVTLAEFHRATATFPLPDLPASRSPGIRSRLVRLGRWIEGDLDRLAEAIQPGLFAEIEGRAWQVLSLTRQAAPSVLALLEQLCDTRVQLQPCICDVWHEHVLFEADRVTGLIDFGSMRPESVAADVARLLGSMAGDDRSKWEMGLEAYQSLRRLSPGELALVTGFDRSTTVLAGLNWLEWIYCQRRVFENRQAIPGRLDVIIQRLARLVSS